MKHKILTLVVLGMLLIMVVSSASAQGTLSDTARTIQVVATGTASGAPDMATVEVGVDMRDANFETAFNAANQALSNVLEALSSVGIASEDIQTTSVNVWLEDEYNPQTGMPTGERTYNVSQSMRIIVRDVNMVGEVITTTLDNGANQIFGLNFSFSDTATLEMTARENAVADARTKAEHLASLMGMEIGEVISIVELGGNSFVPLPMAPSMYDMEGSMAVSPGQSSVTTTIQVVFELQ